MTVRWCKVKRTLEVLFNLHHLTVMMVTCQTAMYRWGCNSQAHFETSVYFFLGPAAGAQQKYIRVWSPGGQDLEPQAGVAPHKINGYVVTQATI